MKTVTMLSTTHFVFLLLDGTAKLHESFGNCLPGLFHDLLQFSRVTLVPLLKERKTSSTLTSATCPTNSMNVILNRERKGEIDDDFDVWNIESDMAQCMKE